MYYIKNYTGFSDYLQLIMLSWFISYLVGLVHVLQVLKEKINVKNTSEKKWPFTYVLYSVLQFNHHLYVNEYSCLIVLLQWREINLTYPPSSEYLCPKARMSEARPLPSHTTTGTGGVSLRYSSTIEITLGPPSTIKATTGTPCPIPAEKAETLVRKGGMCATVGVAVPRKTNQKD